MQDYDRILKNCLTRPGSLLLDSIAGEDRLNWLNVEVEARSLRVDLLGEAASGDLVHIELQSGNEADFALRMAEYCLAIARAYGKFPRQIVLYVGRAPLTLQDRLEGPGLSFWCHTVDIRDLDGERLLTSENLSDNVTAVLTGIGSQPGTVRRILERIRTGSPSEREEALSSLMVLGGLRRLRDQISKEAHHMPITEPLIDDEVFGPLIEKGRAEGLIAGRREGRMEGQIDLIVGMLEARFGVPPTGIRARLAALTPTQLEATARKVITATTPDDIF